MNILITGVAGFIGYHLSKELIKKRNKIIGIDNFTSSYSVSIKKSRIKDLSNNKNFFFFDRNIKDLNKFNYKKKIDAIIHLAAEAGVRQSLKNPYQYIDQNIRNTISVFEFAKKNKIKKIYYASSSSVYGDKSIYPSSEKIQINQPISIYGLTKISNENIAHYYFKIFNINSIGFRFFTVYGPYGRPDMAIFIFIKGILDKKILHLNNYGKNFRDFTYIDDVVKYFVDCVLKSRNKKSFYKIFNIGGESNIKLTSLVKKIETKLNLKAKIKLKPKISLDPISSLADTTLIKKYTGKNYKTSLDKGLNNTIKWLRDYFRI